MKEKLRNKIALDKRPSVSLTQETHDRLKSFCDGVPLHPPMWAVADIAIKQYLDDIEESHAGDD